MNLDAANYETPSHRKSSTSPGFLSPEQESMLSKLRAQELSLNKQHESIQAMLGQLDKSFKGRSILSPNPSTMKPKDRDRLDVKENIPSWGTINNHHSPINGIQSAIAASQRQLQKMRAVRDAAMQQRLQCHSSSLSTPQARPSLQPTLDLSFNSPSGVNTNRVIRHSPSETVAALKQAISDVQDPPVNRKTHSSRASDTNYIPLQQFAKEQAVPASKVKLKSQHGKTSIAVNPELGANSRQYVEAARDSLTRLRQDRIEAGEERQKMKLKAAEALQRQQQERIAQERDRIDAELADTFCRSYCFKRFITRIQHLMKQQQQLYTGNYAHTRNVLRGAIRRLQRSQLHRVLLGDYSYRRAWKMFQKRFFAGVRSHFQLLQSIEIAYQHRLRKNFIKFSSKLRTLRWLRRYRRIDLDAHWWKHTGGSVLNRLLKRVYYSHQPTLAEATMQRLRRKSLLKDAIVLWRNYSSMRRRCKYLVHTSHLQRASKYWQFFSFSLFRVAQQHRKRFVAKNIQINWSTQKTFDQWREWFVNVQQEHHRIRHAGRFRYVPRQEPRREILRMIIRRLKDRRDRSTTSKVNTFINRKSQSSAHQLFCIWKKFAKWRSERRYRVSSRVRYLMLLRNWSFFRASLLKWRKLSRQRHRFVNACQRARALIVAATFVSKLHERAVGALRRKKLLRVHHRKYSFAAETVAMQQLRKLILQRRSYGFSRRVHRRRCLVYHLDSWRHWNINEQHFRKNSALVSKSSRLKRMKKVVDSLKQLLIRKRIQTHVRRSLKSWEKNQKESAFNYWKQYFYNISNLQKHNQLHAKRYEYATRIGKILRDWVYTVAIRKHQQQVEASTKLCSAMCYSYIQRWLAYTTLRYEHRVHATEGNRIAIAHLQRGAFTALRSRCIYEQWVCAMLDEHYTCRLVPLLLRRGLKNIRQHLISRKMKKEDARTLHRNRRLIREGMLQWRRWLRNLRLEQEDIALGTRSRNIVLLLRYFSAWQGRSGSLALQRSVCCRGIRFQQLRLLLPALASWQRVAHFGNLQARAHRMAGELLLKHYWQQWLLRERRMTAGSSMARRCRSPTKKARQSKLTLKQFNMLRSSCHRMKLYKAKIIHAQTLYSHRLLRIVFSAWRRWYEDEAHAELVKLQQYRLQQQRKALRKLRSISWHSNNLKSLAQYQRSTYRRILNGKYRIFVDRCKHQRLLNVRGRHCWSGRVSAAAMGNWYNFILVKRQCRLPSVLHQLLPQQLVQAAITAASPHDHDLQQFSVTTYHRFMHAAYHRCKSLRHALLALVTRKIQEVHRRYRIDKSNIAMRVFHWKRSLLRWQQSTASCCQHREDVRYAVLAYSQTKLRYYWQKFILLQDRNRIYHRSFDHYARFQLQMALKSWKVCTYFGHRRAAARALHQRKRDMERTAAVLGSGNIVLLPDASSTDSNFDSYVVIDFRLSVQRTNLKLAASEFNQRALYHGLLRIARHKERRVIEKRIIRYMREQLLLKNLRRWYQKVYSRLQSIESLHCITLSRADIKKRITLNYLRQHTHLQQVSRRLHRRRCYRFFQRWCEIMSRTQILQGMVNSFSKQYNYQLMKAAMECWCNNTLTERQLASYQKSTRAAKLKLAVNHLLQFQRSSKRCRSLLLRGRSIYTRRRLHSVFINMMDELDLHYRSIEALQNCYRHYQQYSCRHVLHNLFYLRRNRIAKTHALQRFFALLLIALRINRRVVRFEKQNNAEAEWLMLRNSFSRFRQRIRAARGTANLLRIHQLLKDKSGGNCIASKGLTVAAAQFAAYEDWNDDQTARHYLHEMHRKIRSWRAQRKRRLYCTEFHKQWWMRRYLRALLRYGRSRILKRRNIAALQVLHMNMQLRRCFSKLDILVTARWARIEQRRLLTVQALNNRLKQTMSKLQQHKSSVDTTNVDTHIDDYLDMQQIDH